jgi:hypothetical protein
MIVLCHIIKFMSKNVFDKKGREWFIPPCAVEMRVACNEDRVARNPDFRTRTPRDFKLASYQNNGDGGMLVTCIGKEACQGGTVRVDDRHDLLRDKMPETTEALRGICTSREMFYSDHGIIRPFEVMDDEEKGAGLNLRY